MGLNYSIRTYIASTQIATGLNWLFQNSWSHDGGALNMLIDNTPFKIKGDNFELTEFGKKFVANDVPVTQFEQLHFSTSLIFDIDPKVIGCVADWTLESNMEMLEDFKESFEQFYLGNGKMRIGGFDASIMKLKHHDIYELEFTAVTSDMSRMIEKSVSVKKWMLEFSRAAQSILSYIDMESGGKRMVYYNGHQTDLVYKHEIESSAIFSFQNIFADYFALEYDLEPENMSLERPLTTDRINVIEDSSYSVYLLGEKWLLHIEHGYNKTLELNEQEIIRVKKEGKTYMDNCVSEWLARQ